MEPDGAAPERRQKGGITMGRPDAASALTPDSKAGAESQATTRGPIPSLRVAMASPEATPFAKTGGLGDMVGSLIKSLERLGLGVSLVMPAYRSVLKSGFPLEDTGVRFSIPVSQRREEGSLLRARAGNDISVYLIRADRYFDREYLYGTPKGDYPDNAERFVFFCRAVLEVLRMAPPQVLHAHDWQSALSIAFLKAQPHLYMELAAMKTAFTVHNLGYQGLFGSLDWPLLNLDGSFFTPHYLEFYGKINFLKGGLVMADALTTVSPTYAEEVKMAEQGFGLEGVFQERAGSLTGIINGADYDLWNPETDPFITKTYSAGNLAGKRLCKTDLQHTFRLAENPDIPLIGMVSRLSRQKGIDLLEKALGSLLSRNVQLVILGTGDKPYEDLLRRAAGRYPKQLGVEIAFDESVAHKIIAGADLFLMPSRYEPSGLTQLYSLKYGTIPVVRATGGLKDTIQEFQATTGRGNGFLFGPSAPAEFLAALTRALSLYHRREAWITLMRNAMTEDFSWEKSARAYADLYRKLLAT